MGEHETHLTGMFFSNALLTELVKIVPSLFSCMLVMNGDMYVYIYTYLYVHRCSGIYMYMYLITQVSQEASGQV